MKDHSFDNHIKKQLENFASPIPEGMWDRIVQEKQRRPAIFWWNSKPFLIFTLLLCSSTLGSFILYQQHLVEQKNELIAATNNTQNTVKLSTLYTNSQQVKLINNSSVAIKNNTKLNIQTTPNTRIHNKDYIQQLEQLIAENSTTNASEINAFNIQTENNELQNYSAANSIKNTSTENSSINFKKEQTQNIFYKKPLLKQDFFTNFNLKSTNPQDCPEINKERRNDWYVEGYVSPEFTFKKLSTNNDNAAYLDKKDSAETMRVGITLGIRISKNITDNIMLKAGIQFSQLNEQVNLRRENERRLVTTVVIRTVTDAFGNTTTVADTTTTVQIGYLVNQSKNYYRNIELPLTIGYEFSYKKFRASINGGAIINLASWYSGKALDTSYQLVNVNNKEDVGITKHNVGVSLYGSISLIKPITNSIDVFAEPYFRYSLTKLQNTAYGFSQRFSAAGISFGIRYKLNGNKQRYE